MMQIPLKYILRSSVSRRLTTVITMLGVALVVFVFSAVLMMANGVQKTLRSTGSDDNLIVVRKAALSEIMRSFEMGPPRKSMRACGNCFRKDQTAGNARTASPRRNVARTSRIFLIDSLRRCGGIEAVAAVILLKIQSSSSRNRRFSEYLKTGGGASDIVAFVAWIHGPSEQTQN